MLGNIARIVGQFKQSWSQELEGDAIERACQEAGHKWRERELGPVATVKMFLLQILYGNVDALRWLATAQPGDELPDLVINPSRPGRLEPRVLKRRPKPFKLMTKPRAVLRQELAAQALGA